jgi:hypothetical protein
MPIWNVPFDLFLTEKKKKDIKMKKIVPINEPTEKEFR